MVKKISLGFFVVSILTFGVINTAFVNLASAQHYQVLQPDGKEVLKEEGKEGAKAEEGKEEKCKDCKHLPSKPEGDCRCECHHRHK